MKVVKRKSDGEIVYRSDPEFEKGFGIKNAVAIHGGLPEDYEETEITKEEWSTKVVSPIIQENRVNAEMQRLTREQAIINLADPNIETKVILSNPIENLEIKGWKSKNIYEGEE